MRFRFWRSTGMTDELPVMRSTGMTDELPVLAQYRDDGGTSGHVQTPDVRLRRLMPVDYKFQEGL